MQPRTPSLPSIFLANATSADWRLNCWPCPWLLHYAHHRVTGTPMNPGQSPPTRTPVRAEVVCYVHSDWCMDSKIIHTHCSPNLEVMTLVCQLFYLHRELTMVIITAVYIPHFLSSTLLGTLIKMLFVAYSSACKTSILDIPVENCQTVMDFPRHMNLDQRLFFTNQAVKIGPQWSSTRPPTPAHWSWTLRDTE